MGDVLAFKPRVVDEPQVWQCNCGSFAFWLYSDGSVTCARCEQEATEMQGYWEVPKASEG